MVNTNQIASEDYAVMFELISVATEQDENGVVYATDEMLVEIQADVSLTPTAAAKQYLEARPCFNEYKLIHAWEKKEDEF